VAIWSVTYNLKKQAKIGENIKRLEAKSSFQLQALEILLGSKSTEAAKGRAVALQKIIS
jgi:hypothetical protein